MVAVRVDEAPVRSMEGIRQAEDAWRAVSARWDDRFGLGLQDFLALRDERWKINREVLGAYARFFGPQRAMTIIAQDNEHRRILAEERDFERMIGERAAAERQADERHHAQLRALREQAKAAGDKTPQYVVNRDGYVVYPIREQEADIKFVLLWAERNGWPELDIGATIIAFRQRVTRPEHYQALPIYLTISSGERAWRGILRWLPGSWKYLPMLIREHLES